MKKRNVALVTGAGGVVGRSLVQYLCGTGGWDVIGISRRRPDVDCEFHHLAIDLQDRTSINAQLGGLRDVTHAFHCAYAERATPAELVAPNLAMLVNTVEAIEPVAARLQRVVLVQGTKYYGTHLGPFKTPAREDDPRHLPPNFYYDMQDYLATRCQGKAWTWAAARPHGLFGFSLGSPMNLSMAVAVFALISKELGVPLCHPGTVRNYRALYQCTDVSLLARALTWMATEPRCANHAFNVTNGDLIRWENVWPKLADFFDIQMGPPRKISLVQTMSDKGPIWDRIVEKHHLRPYPYEQIVAWRHYDYVFSTEHDIISDTGKVRRFGFTECVDTEEMFSRVFESYRRDRIIP